MTLALIGFAALMLLGFLRVPIAFAMILVGFAGMAVANGLPAALANVGETAFSSAKNYELSVVPLFVLMGNFVTKARLSEELYRASHAFLGHYRGGLAMATIVACGGFSAICGSSLATAATMSKVAMPSMRKYHYSDSLAAGSIAAGGTLGILIPPSVLLVIYGILTNTSIGKLFAAGLIPGLIGVLFYMGAVRFTTWRKPDHGPAVAKASWSERGKALLGVWAVLLLFIIIMTGIYAGWFTATEASGIGALGAFAIALFRRALTWKTLYEVFVESVSTTAMLFTVLIGALLFANFINYTSFPQALLDIANTFSGTPIMVVIALLVIYIVLGCVFESLSMILLTVPIFAPMVQQLSLGMTPTETMVWFGIIVVVVTEISLITPPVGLNVFVLRGVLPDVTTGTIFKGVTPFWIADIFRLALFVFIPPISLWFASFVK